MTGPDGRALEGITTNQFKEYVLNIPTNSPEEKEEDMSYLIDILHKLNKNCDK